MTSLSQRRECPSCILFGTVSAYVLSLGKVIAVGIFARWLSDEREEWTSQVSRSDLRGIRESDWLVCPLDNQRLGGNCPWEKTTEEKTIKSLDLNNKNIATVAVTVTSSLQRLHIEFMHT